MATKVNDAELQNLVDGCRRKEMDCQQKLYKHFYSFAMAKCLRYSGTRYEAAEILNDGFMKVFTRIHQYVDTIPFHSWLGKIMTNTAIDHYRSELKHSHTTDLSVIDDVSHEVTVDQSLNYQDMLNIVRQLPTSYRTVFNLYAIDGYSHDEISKALGISVGTSKSHLFKARQKLQKWLSYTVSERIKTTTSTAKVVHLPVRNRPSKGLSINGGLEL